MKKKMGVKNCLYPMPTVLVGANIDGKANYLTIAHVGIMDLTSISLGIHKSHFTNRGIKENRTFSINIPSIAQVKETDYCGIVSGKNYDKSELFANFYGVLETAPMIQSFPVNMECRLLQIVDFPQHEIFIGQIVETYCDESCLNGNKLDIAALRPFLFSMDDRGYWSVGERIGTAWEIGKTLK